VVERSETALNLAEVGSLHKIYDTPHVVFLDFAGNLICSKPSRCARPPLIRHAPHDTFPRKGGRNAPYIFSDAVELMIPPKLIAR